MARSKWRSPPTRRSSRSRRAGTRRCSSPCPPCRAASATRSGSTRSSAARSGDPMRRVPAAVALLFPSLLAAPALHAQVPVRRIFDLEGEVAGAWFGRPCYVGDLDLDGFDDFVVGAPNESPDLDH